ncbi:MAG: TetM/TetW/TetO/TetS family tetracycline resistance ribosomal protection protein, partial [Bacteroidetes bacterium]|nr:TetM/TetW/TetO/TetS family tetracycline resistance ribosomal protection protein [Bacteroidota bacterium]
MLQNRKFINIGIVAHVDAGKTSITELFLYKSGITRAVGSVDKGTSQTDWLRVERERGISVRSASASFTWNDININIVDTPGHVDFSSEVERSMLAMDCAILVISAAEGVQSHTETLWNALQKTKIPAILFINKIDRAGSNIDSVIAEIRKELTSNIIVMQSVINEGSDAVEISNIVNSNSFSSLSENSIESIIHNDEILLDSYLVGEKIDSQKLKMSLKDQFHKNELFPVLFGSAKYDIGIDDLLDVITEYMPVAKGDSTKPLSGIVYKVEHNKTIGKIASVRLFEGSIKNRDIIHLGNNDLEEKVSQIRKLQGQKYIDVGELMAGDTAAICGLSSVVSGDIIGNPDQIKDSISLNTPMLTAKISPMNEEDYSTLVSAIHILSDEDPTLDLIWLKDERELHIKIMGLIQLEILEFVLSDRFQIAVNFGKPTVIYKETPAVPFEAYEEYTMPKPCWAVVRFKIEPGARNSGIKYNSIVGVNSIAVRYQNEVERTIPIALQQGPFGWEVTDLIITLIGDEDHNIHSRAGDFAVASPMAIMKGLKENGTKLLEPILEYTITANEDKLGSIVGSLTQLRADIGNPNIENHRFTLSGTIPVSTSLDYSTKFSSLTGGKGKFATKFHGYKECPIELGETTPFRGINPLDRAK